MSQISAPARTSTGLLSSLKPQQSRRSINEQDQGANDHDMKLTLLAIAKRKAARTRLYANFFRGPVLTPLDEPCVPPVSSTLPCDTEATLSEPRCSSIPSSRALGQQVASAETSKKKRRRKCDPQISHAEDQCKPTSSDQTPPSKQNTKKKAKTG